MARARNSVKVELEINDQLFREIRHIPQQFRTQAAESVIRSVSKLIVRRAKALVPVGTKRRGDREHRHLRDSISYRIRYYTNAIVSVIGPTLPHGHLVEFGHRIMPTKKQKARAFRSRRFGKMTEATPFMRPAADNSKVEVARLVRRRAKQWWSRKLRQLKQTERRAA